MREVLSSLAWFAAMAGSAFYLGGAFGGRPFGGMPKCARVWLGATLGLVMWTGLAMGMAASGDLKAGALVIVACASGGALRWLADRFGKRPISGIPRDLAVLLRGIPMRGAAWFVVAIVVFVAFAASLGPEVRGDSIIYHISAAMLIAVNGGFVEIPTSVLTYIPQNQQLLYALGIALSGEGVGRLLHWFAGVLLLTGTFSTAQLLGVSRRGAMGAVALVALIPVWAYLATSTYVDLAVANYTLAALYLLLAVDRSDGAERGRGPAARCIHPLVGAALVGLFAGAAMGCKYTAGVVGFLPIFAVAFAQEIWPPQSRANPTLGDSAFRNAAACPQHSPRSAFLRVAVPAVIAISALAAFSPWLIRNALWTGNPVAPSLMRLLGPPGVPESTLAWPDIQAGGDFPWGRPGAMFAAYAAMFFAFADYGNYLPMIALIVAAVAAFLGGPRELFPRPVRLILLFLAVAYLLGVPTGAIRRDSRYVMAHAALVAALIALWYEKAEAEAGERRRLVRAAAAGFVALLAVNWAVTTWRLFGDLNEQLLPPLTARARAEYRRARLADYDANMALSAAAAAGSYPPGLGRILGAAYPARVNYVLGGAPIRESARVQRPDAVGLADLPGLRAEGVRFIFGQPKQETEGALRRVGEFAGKPLYEIPGGTAAD